MKILDRQPLRLVHRKSAYLRVDGERHLDEIVEMRFAFDVA
jgi:hypothetical protein